MTSTEVSLKRLYKASNNVRDFLSIPASLESGSRRVAHKLLQEFEMALKEAEKQVLNKPVTRGS